MVEVEHLRKSFETTQAVDDLSFTINSGEIIGFLGPNGAGKTTTMRLLTGYYMPDEGSVKIKNVDIAENPIEAQKYIGYLPENNPLYKDMLVSEHLSLSAKLHNVPQNKVQESLDFVVPAVGLQEYYYRPAGELSKGYRQRLGMAMALLHQPDILIMDEPTEGLDPNQRTEIRALIRGLAEDRTIIMSTHVMQEVTAVCNRILILNHGNLVADGTAEELSQISGDTRVTTTQIAGSNVTQVLDALEEVEHIIIDQEQDDRVTIQIVTQREIELPPLLSQLAKQHDWVIWHLLEEKQDLEDVFHSLTIDKDNEL